MRSLTPLALIVLFLIAMSTALAGVASTLALTREDSSLDADLSALIEADYGADPRGGLAPLDPRVIDDARSDESQLQATGSDLELVQVFHLPAGADDGSSEPPATVNAPDATATGTPSPGSSPAPGDTPAPGGSQPDDPGDPGTPDTPGSPPGGSPGPTPTPDNGTTPPKTPTPAPTAVVPTPTPTPAPPVTVTYYLHNNPSPPVADTNSQTILPLNTTVPTASTLYNYDADRDSSAGLLIQHGSGGAAETDPTKYQAWRTPLLGKNTTITGNVSVTLWAAMEDFKPDKPGSMTIYLRSYHGESAQYTELAQTTVNSPNWHAGSSGWVQKTAQLPLSTVTVPAGHRLELKVTVNSALSQDMMLAYDTTTYRSLVKITHN